MVRHLYSEKVTGRILYCTSSIKNYMKLHQNYMQANYVMETMHCINIAGDHFQEVILFSLVINVSVLLAQQWSATPHVFLVDTHLAFISDPNLGGDAWDGVVPVCATIIYHGHSFDYLDSKQQGHLRVTTTTFLTLLHWCNHEARRN